METLGQEEKFKFYPAITLSRNVTASCLSVGLDIEPGHLMYRLCPRLRKPWQDSSLRHFITTHFLSPLLAVTSLCLCLLLCPPSVCPHALCPFLLCSPLFPPLITPPPLPSRPPFVWSPSSATAPTPSSYSRDRNHHRQLALMSFAPKARGDGGEVCLGCVMRWNSRGFRMPFLPNANMLIQFLLSLFPSAFCFQIYIIITAALSGSCEGGLRYSAGVR